MITFASVFGSCGPDTLAFLEEAWQLKDQVRSGWLLRGVPEPESVADHSWGTALLVALFGEGEGVDRTRALEIALLHDVAEARTGDTPTRVRPEDRQVTPEEKRRREYEAMDEILASIRACPTGGGQKAAEWVMERFSEYEERHTPEARFVADMNLIDMVLQALRYRRADRYDKASDALDPAKGEFPGLSEFFATAEPRLSSDTGRRLFATIRDAYEELTQ
jgi:putative hydrolases of HD superfamily